MRLPIHQVRKGQPRPAALFIQPDAEVMQGHLCRQARLKTTQRMRPFTIKAEGMLELVIDRLYNLADSRKPALQGLGPWCLVIPFGRADDLGAVEPPPYRMVPLP